MNDFSTPPVDICRVCGRPINKYNPPVRRNKLIHKYDCPSQLPIDFKFTLDDFSVECKTSLMTNREIKHLAVVCGKAIKAHNKRKQEELKHEANSRTRKPNHRNSSRKESRVDRQNLL